MSTFKSSVFVVEVVSDLISLRGTIVSQINLPCTLLYGLVFVNEKLYVSAHESSGGMNI